MGDWKELVQAVFIGLAFSFLVAKLISTVVSFRDENLKLAREEGLAGGPGTSRQPLRGVKSQHDPPPVETPFGAPEQRGVLGDEEEDDDDDDDDDDWEGVESTELDETFSAATAFVAATAADRTSGKVPNDVQLQLYGLYKIAIEGPCTVPQPPAFKVTARAKWNAWQRLGAMPTEEAMQKYIMIVSELFPTWANGSTTKNKKEDNTASSSSAKGAMGPVFSSFVHEEDSDNDLKLEAIHVYAREGETDDLLMHIENGGSVNSRDSEGRTPLHWAVDRGHLNAVEILISKNADVNAKDDEGQTPLHYAVVCEREAIAELLVKHNADCDMKDEDGNSPIDICRLSWAFLTSSN